MGSQLLLASTSPHVQLWWGSEYLGVSNAHPNAAKSKLWLLIIMRYQVYR